MGGNVNNAEKFPQLFKEFLIKYGNFQRTLITSLHQRVFWPLRRIQGKILQPGRSVIGKTGKILFVLCSSHPDSNLIILILPFPCMTVHTILFCCLLYLYIGIPVCLRADEKYGRLGYREEERDLHELPCCHGHAGVAMLTDLCMKRHQQEHVFTLGFSQTYVLILYLKPF